MISRRMLEVYNSTGDHLPELRRKFPYSPAFMHPQDLARLGVDPGEVVRIESDHSFIYAIAAPSRAVLPGVISMAHARGGTADDINSTNRLVTTERDFEPISGIPRQSAVPVNVRPLAALEQG
ncbi:MAG TPA: molybdopterin dinucleotide binding domain-containing protein [Candidatus Margulisiibacteriota bacterium]|nr:molybdopterin dinucleotide binding domain-containing protein [Candidatus Margulisiibacteriota bacterium]